MKKKLLAIVTITGALALSGCSFFDILTSSTSVAPWTGEKQKLQYTLEDLSPVHYYDLAYMPTHGNPKLLVLPITFKDSDKYINEEEKVTIRERLEKMAFGNEEDTGWYSISSYYEAESFGKCKIEGEVADWYESNSYYDSVDTTEKTTSLVKQAVNDWKIKNPSKVKDFDSNNDGFIDGVMAIYGGPNYKNARGKAASNSNMWAYTSWFEEQPNLASPNGNAYVWASYDFMDEDNTHEVVVDTHTYIHEMGHVMGLDDYYDYATDNAWAGGYSMQDYNVGGHDPYSLISFGWVEPYVPTESATITIKPFVTSGDVILLSQNFSANSPFDEYILIELYSPTGVNEHDSEYQYQNKYPIGPNRVGVRIWHVDSRLIKITEGRNRRGQTIKQYDIVNTIDPKSGSYIVGCTNTSYTGNPDTDAYCSVVSELRNYRLLELIRKGDYLHSKTEEYVSNNFLFRQGDTFSLTQYSGYFPNGNRLNNGSRFSWNIKIASLNNSEASITVTHD